MSRSERFQVPPWLELIPETHLADCWCRECDPPTVIPRHLTPLQAALEELEEYCPTPD